MKTRLEFCFGLLVTLSVVGANAEDVSYNRDIRPILSDRCFYCHGFDENHRAADLRLDVREEAEYVLAVDAPDESELIARIISEDPDVVMPPPSSHKQVLNPEETLLIRRWIAQGAEYEPHWAFVAPRRAEIKATEASAVIDEFVARQHKARGVQFADAASPAKWLRRAALDLTGTPPTVSELESFELAVADRGEVAYREAVDALLDSPAYGERMALDWLDVARFADTNGFQSDAYRMNWPWRDWVINAFNQNMPFDQFTIEQLAGDLLQNPSEDQLIATAFNRNHMIQAEGGSIPEENRAKNGFDRVETTGTTWLGLTVGCCQCHDHKFDPMKQSEYYSLMAFFNQISETGMTSKKMTVKDPGDKYEKKYWVDKPFIAVGGEAKKQQLEEKRKLVAAKRKELSDRREEYLADARRWVEEIRKDPEAAEEAGKLKQSEYVARFLYSANLDDPNNGHFKQLINTFLKRSEPWKTLQREIDQAVAEESRLQEQIPLVMVMRDDAPRETFVMQRGNYETLGEKVSAATPAFLPPLVDTEDRDAPNRLSLAKWLVSPEHPLTARVTVNRYWQLLFGRGLVSTPDDFGLQGALPTHPDLLDWLAVEFQESGWDVKRLLRSLVLSRTYRQSARATAESYANDPHNEWLTRGPRQRLDSRLLRDQALSLAGLLNSELGGPPVFPYQPGGIWEAMSLNKNHYVQDQGHDLYRRSLYTVWRRVVAPANFFDVPSRQSCSVSFNRTSTPLHALTTLNDVTYVEAARVWAEKTTEIRNERKRLNRLFYAATARKPSRKEVAALKKTLATARQRFQNDTESANKFVSAGEAPLKSREHVAEHAAWTTLCLMVLNLDETLCK